MLGAFPDTTLKGFVSPLRIKPGIVCLLGKCVNHYNTLMEINEIAYLTITVHLIALRHMLFTHFLM